MGGRTEEYRRLKSRARFHEGVLPTWNRNLMRGEKGELDQKRVVAGPSKCVRRN